LSSKKKRQRISVALPEEDIEWLRERYKDAGKGIREIVKDAMIRYAEPTTPTLRLAYRILLTHAEAPGFIKWFNAREAIMKELKVTSETFEDLMRELCREGFIRTIETGFLQVRQPGEPTWPEGLEAIFG